MWMCGAIIGLLFICKASSKAVFAHFMVENVRSWSASKWASEILVAQAAHLDGFALNMRSDDKTVDKSLEKAFTAAECTGFKLFFSFDYAGGGPWPQDRVQSLIKKYQTNIAYFQHNGRPLVSTFEGSQNASDWNVIKATTNCFFMPDWSSIGPQKALDFGVADGLFSWNAWPNGPHDMTTDDDEYYSKTLNESSSGLPYMMPVSPWFFTNLPGYEKNWLWRGDDLWYDRWQQVLAVDPEFVQIVTWNDYGESHYIGPLHDESYDAFRIGQAPFNYVADMPHDGWRTLLPYLIDMYKNGNAEIKQDGVVSWYRLNSRDACGDGGTTGNVASHGQQVYEPAEIVQDKIFYSALLKSPAQISVTVGGTDLDASWRNSPNGGSGLYHGSVPYNTSTGVVVVNIMRNDSTSIVLNGEAITPRCAHDVQNWNAWVGSEMASCPGCAEELSNSTCVTSEGASKYALVSSRSGRWVMLIWAFLWFVG